MRVIKSDELQFTSLKAMSAVVCAGVVFEKSALEQQGYIYGWLDSLMDCLDEKVHRLGRKTVELLLMNNEDIPYLLYWVIDRCYTGSRLIQECSFTALAKVFSKSDYPCDKVAILNVVLYKTAETSSQIHDQATQLLQTLDRRFFRSPSGASALSGCLTSTYSQSQLVLSQQLARAHPELTLAIFSEFSQRFELCPRSGQRYLLQYIIPWLENVELVDLYPRTQQASMQETVSLQTECPQKTPAGGVRLVGSGWGSPVGSQLVLNNLFYITAKYGDHDFVKEAEILWSSLCGWENNIRAILNYLISLAGQSGSSILLTHAKRVIVCLGRTQPKAVVAELLKEMQSVEVLSATIEKSSVAPYYRVVRTPSSVGQSRDASQASHDPNSVRRRDKNVESPSNEDPESTATEGQSRSEDIHIDGFPEGDWATSWIMRLQAYDGNPVPLPVPPGGGYYCPLVDMMPVSSQSTPLHRCNFALMLLTELVVDRVDISWAAHLPLLLHVLFLGLDHVKPLVYEHCKRLLTNLVLVLACKVETRQDINANQATSICSPSTSSLGGDPHSQPPPFSPMSVMSVEQPYATPVPELTSEADSPPRLCSSYSSSSTLQQNEQSSLSLDRNSTGGEDRQNSLPESQTARPLTQDEEIELQSRSLIEFVTTRDRHKPLWPYEEITTRATSIKSTAHLEALLCHVLKVFSCLPGSDIRRLWAKVALQWATSCSSRHYAGRSFQICRALRLPLSWSMLVDILSRLVDSVGDPSPDVQGYVMEILLTLASAVDNGVGEIKYLDNGIFESEDDLNDCDSTMSAVRRPRQSSSRNYRDTSQRDTSVSRNGTAQAKRVGNRRSPQVEHLVVESSTTKLSMRRSASTSFEPFVRKEDTIVPNVVLKRRPHSLVKQRSPEEYMDCEIDSGTTRNGVNGISDSSLNSEISRLKAKSMVSLSQKASSTEEQEGRSDDNGVNSRATVQTASPGEFRDLLSKLFWVASAVMYSDYEHEFLMAVRLMNKVLDTLSAEEPDFVTQLASVLTELDWIDFPGVQCLLMKGLTSSATAEATTQLLARITPIANHHVFTCYPGLGFPINVTCLLPHLGYRFNDRDHFCSQVAATIEHVCSDSSLPRLDRLFQLYREGAYEKSSGTWITSICKYLLDAYCEKEFHVFMMPFLSEVLEFGPHSFQKPVLQILGVLSQPRDVSLETAQKLNNLVQRIVARFVKTDLWEDAVEILKQSIANAAKLPPTPRDQPSLNPSVAPAPSMEVQSSKRELLPGPTLDIMVELSRTGYVRDAKGTAVTEANAESSVPWKKPQQSQRRTRERVAAVLKTCGHQSGVPHSSSVVFSDDLSPDRQVVYSSSEEASVQEGLPGTGSKTDNEAGEEPEGPEQIIGILTTEFDFLDDELDQQGDLSSLDNPFGFSLRRLSLESLEDSDRPNLVDNSKKSGSVPSIKQAVDLEDSNTRDILFTASDRFDSVSQRRTSYEIDKTEKDNVESSDGDKVEVSPSMSSPRLPRVESFDVDDSQVTFHRPLASEFVSVASEEVEAQWRAHVSTVLTDTTGAAAVNTYHLFNQLFKTTRRRVAKLTRDSCGYLSENCGVIASQFLRSVDILSFRVEFPHVYTDTEVISSAGLLERHKFHVMELNENFTAYTQQRDLTMEQVENIKVSMRRMSVSSVEGSMSSCSHVQVCLCCLLLFHSCRGLLSICLIYVDVVVCFVSSPSVRPLVRPSVSPRQLGLLGSTCLYFVVCVRADSCYVISNCR
jgi:hypothetical protein